MAAANYQWITDPQTGEQERVSYDDLDSDVYGQLFKPVGRFSYRAEDFLRLNLPKVPFYIDRILPKQGKAMFFAQGKKGKSWLTYQMARCIAQGEDWLGMPTTKGKVYIIQFELGERTLLDRLASTGQDYSNVYVGSNFSIKLDSRQGQDEFKYEIEAIKPNVVIIDPLYKAIKGDENESHDMSVITDFLDSTIAEHKADGMSYIIMHHAGKDLSRGGRGSSLLEGWVDTYLEIKRTNAATDPELKIRIMPKLLRHSEPFKPIFATLANGEFYSEAIAETVKSKVWRYLSADCSRSFSPNDLVVAKLGSRKGICNALEDLIVAGVVIKPERGQYQAISGVEPPEAKTTRPDTDDDEIVWSSKVGGDEES